MTIPPEFISENKRLKWEYFFSEPRGAPTEAMKDILSRGYDFNFVEAVLPYVVRIEWFDKDKDESIVKDEWMNEHVSGAWTLWVDGVFFEKAEDAFWFKMNFDDGTRRKKARK